MLINIDPILSPELLHALRSMGHGDKLVLADANFPSASLAKKLIRLDGVNIPNAAKAILSVLPLDSFVDYPIERMEIDDNPDEINDLNQDLIDDNNHSKKMAEEIIDNGLKNKLTEAIQWVVNNK